MTWRVLYRQMFYEDLAGIPSRDRERIEKVVFNQGFDPFATPNVRKLKGWYDKYRIRSGNYRIGITIDQDTHTVTFERVGLRPKFYRVFP